jgi:hypothetical protein
VNDFFSPHHVTIEATNTSEVSDKIVTETIAKASGTKSHVLDTVVSSGQVAMCPLVIYSSPPSPPLSFTAIPRNGKING